MLLGDKGKLGFELTPIAPSWKVRDATEASAWAGLAVWVDGRNLCRHVEGDSGDLRDCFFVPLGPIADWIVRSFPAIAFEERAEFLPTPRQLHSAVRGWAERAPLDGVSEDEWIDAREAFWSRHFLMAGAEGARLPNLALHREDPTLVVSWEQPRFVSPPLVQMIEPPGCATIPWDAARPVLDGFVEQVAHWLEADDPYPWVRVTNPLAVDLDRALPLFCARPLRSIAEILLVPLDRLHETLGLQVTDEPSRSPVCQIIRDLPPKVSSGVGEVLLSVGRRASTDLPRERERWLAERALAREASRAGTTVEEKGQLAARDVRRRLGLDDQPIGDLLNVMRDAFGIDVERPSIST